MLERVKSNCVLCAEFTKLFSNMRVLYTISSTRISLFHKDIFWEILSFCSCCYCFVFFWGGASLVAQLVKSLPAVQETLVQFLCWEDLLEKG